MLSDIGVSPVTTLLLRAKSKLLWTKHLQILSCLSCCC